MRGIREQYRPFFRASFPLLLFMAGLQIFFRPFDLLAIQRLLLSLFLMGLGQGSFFTGLDLGLHPVAKQLGKRSLSLSPPILLVVAALVLGFFISLTDPNLLVLQTHVLAITSGRFSPYALLVAVAFGVGSFLVLGFFRLMKAKDLRWTLLLAYLAIGLLSALVSSQDLAIAFDASAASTGVVCAVFLLAFGDGMQLRYSHRRDSSQSFGMIGLASAGAILLVLLLSLFQKDAAPLLSPSLPRPFASDSLLAPFLALAWPRFLESLLVLFPLSLVFFITEARHPSLRMHAIKRISFGLVYTLLGFFLFLLGVSASLLPLAYEAGQVVGDKLPQLLWPFLGLLLGYVTLLSEPAVHVLSQGIEEKTAGHLPRRLIRRFIHGAVTLAVALGALLMQVQALELWVLLLPIYLCIFLLGWKNPPLFTGIAFDAGGVASGPIAVAFVLPFLQGLASSQGPGLKEPFGVLALIAALPILSLQFLGFLYRRRLERTAP